MGTTTTAILTAAPLAKDISEQFGIEPRRTASLLDIFSTTSVGFLFWAGIYVFVQGLVGVNDVMPIVAHGYYFWLVLIYAIITIQFNLLSGQKKQKEKQQ